MGNTKHAVHAIAPKTWLIDEFGLDTIYLLEGADRALLIDAGTGVGDLRALLSTLTDKPLDVAATHAHTDHIGGTGQFPRLHIHPEDIKMPYPTAEARRGYAGRILAQYPERKGSFTLDEIVEGPEPEKIPIREGHVFDLGGRIIETLEVPGHTAGSLVFLDRKNRLLISGDALNPIFLLRAPAPTRQDAVREFLKGAKRVAAVKDSFDAMYGGHCGKDPLDSRFLPELIACASGILDGSIPPVRKQIHIFDAPFYSYGQVNIVTELGNINR